MMGHVEARYDAEALRSQMVRPFEKADRIVEDVVFPMDLRGLRLDLQARAVQPQIVAVIGAHHQSMAQQADRIAIFIFRRVDHADSSPRRLLPRKLSPDLIRGLL